MKNNSVYFLIGIAFFCTSLSAQQAPSWSSFYETGFTWNPALTARWSSWEMTTTFRQEWSGFEDAPQYGTAGFQYPFLRNKTRIALGGYADFDQVGPYKSVGIGGTYAYKMYPGWFGNRDGVFTLGMGAKLSQFRFNATQLRAFDGIEGDFTIPENGQSFISPDVSAGFFYNSVSDFYDTEPHYYFGASINRLIPLSNEITPFGNWRVVPHANLHGGFRYKSSRRSTSYLEPSVMVSYAFTKVINIMAHVRYEKEQKYWMSVGGVSNGEIFGQVGVIFNDRSPLGWLVNDGILRIGTKVDYSLGSLRQFAGMGYEAFISYSFSNEPY